MTITAAIAAIGTILKMDDGAGNFSTILEVYAVDGYKLKTDVKDATSFTSTAQYSEVIPTLKHAGEITFTINYVPSNASHKNAVGGLVYAFDNRLKRQFQVNFSDSVTVWACQGYITSFNPKLAVDDRVTADVTVSLTGQPTLQ